MTDDSTRKKVSYADQVSNPAGSSSSSSSSGSSSGKGKAKVGTPLQAPTNKTQSSSSFDPAAVKAVQLSLIEAAKELRALRKDFDGFKARCDNFEACITKLEQPAHNPWKLSSGTPSFLAPLLLLPIELARLFKLTNL